MKDRRFLFFALIYVVLLCCYSVFSYALTDPNLVLTQWSWYWQFQQVMWHTFFSNPNLLTSTFVALLLLLFASYCGCVCTAPKKRATWKVGLILLAISLPLFFSYNALSHDVFNYIFNAKMVVVYHANPHISVALDYKQDDWTRFMHNTHTAAPYGYGWTIFSLVPYVAGFNKFLPTWLIFRGLSVISVLLLFGSLLSVAQNRGTPLTFRDAVTVFLHPLFLIEIISNAHNDLWMIAPAVAAFALATQKRKLHPKEYIAIVALLIFSISIKFATVLLVPLLFIVLILKNAWLQKNWPVLASLLLFFPLLTDRSQQFNPWYFTWILVWLPFMTSSIWKNWLLALSYSSLFRYVPWLQTGYFTDQVIQQQKAITWLGAAVITFLITCKDKLHRL